MSLRIKEAPTAFSGTLGELYAGWAQHVLLAPSLVEEFHDQFRAYLCSADPVFLVRMVKGQERGQTLRTGYGTQLRPTDNAPAWWIHHQLFSHQFRHSPSFAAFIESVPCHMFRVRMPENINKAGWHVAHIFAVKDGAVQFGQWDRDELMRRTARNIHPCNYFYIPKGGWQHYGGNPEVIAFFYEKFRSMYRTIWEDFLRLVGGTPPAIQDNTNNFLYSFSTMSATRRDGPRLTSSGNSSLHGCVAQYSHSRLCFKSHAIEPLGMDDRFCVVTNVGTFAMSKREFYETFPKVRESKSYRQDKVYHYRKPPRRALQFLVNPVGTA